MKKSTSIHVGEGVRNTIIGVAIFAAIALITYLEWKGNLGH
ncbi:hypothetical protein [Segetibacter sp. 3557_3]|nr:hypothetical protein [Segetibacter sp. 3557_3]